MNSALKDINRNLIEKYNQSCPYYTSYPTLSEWSSDFTSRDYIAGLTDLCTKGAEVPLYLYIHFPFCVKQCFYCICNSIVTHDRIKIKNFLDYLFYEIDLLRAFFEKNLYIPNIKKIHLGGGSPTFMEVEEFDRLIEGLKTIVDFKNLDEFNIEVDTNTTSQEKLKYYHEKGVNRISLGIQDFEPKVQKAVNRIQSPELVEKLLSPGIRRNFESVNFDLLYGLPFQNTESFKRTIEIVKRLSPDRITLLKYAHVPERRRHQRLIKETDLPEDYEKNMIFIETVCSLTDNGYEFIGIDHFTKSTDSLTKAVKNKTIWRNFNGFTPGEFHYIIGIGPTSTHSVTNYYAQSLYSLKEYYKSIDNQEFPILRGYRLSNDDMIRRDVINEILCYQSLDFSTIEDKHNIDFSKYFKQEIEALDDLAKDEMLNLSGNRLAVTLKGRIFIRHICKVFDHYLQSGKAYKITGP